MSNYRSKTRHRRSSKIFIKEQNNNNSFFEENENNLYFFLKDNNFEEFNPNQNNDLNESRFSRGMTRAQKTKYFQNMKTQKSNGSPTINRGMTKMNRSSLNYSNFNNLSKFKDDEFEDESKSPNISRGESKSFYKSQFSKIKTYNDSPRKSFQKFIPRQQNEAELKIKINREIKNDKYFIDKKSPRNVDNSIDIPMDNSIFDAFDSHLEKNKEETKKNNIKLFKDNILDKSDIKDVEILKNIDEYNIKNKKTLIVNREESTFILNEIEKFSDDSKNSKLKDKKYKITKDDYFNNEFKDDEMVKMIKNKKNIKIYDFEVNNFLKNLNKKDKEYLRNQDILINQSLFKSEIDKTIKTQITKKINKTEDEKLAEWEKLNKSKDDEFKNIFHENIPNKIIYDKLLRQKAKWEKENREKKIKEYKNENSKFFNNVILLRPEIIQSQKQTQFDVIMSKNNIKKNINYVNFILKKAHEKDYKDEKKGEEIKSKIDLFAKKMEKLEQIRFNHFRRFEDIKESENLQIIKKQEYIDDHSEKIEFDSDNPQSNILNSNQVGIRTKSNFYKKNLLTSKVNLQSQLKTIETKNLGTSIVWGSGNESIFKSSINTSIKKLNCFDCLRKLFGSVIGFLISDPEKSFAEKKIIWKGKLGAFPKEFHDKRKL